MTAGLDAGASAADRVVARVAGLAPRTGPDAGADRPVREAVRRSARTLGVRTREVRLDGRWWRSDLGPLVGYAAGTGAPLALLPGLAGYRAERGDGGPPFRIDGDSGAAIDTRATLLLPVPPPPDVPGPAPFLAWALRAGRSDTGVTVAAAAGVAAGSAVLPVAAGRGAAEALGGSMPVTAMVLLVVAALLTAGLVTVRDVAALRWRGRVAVAAHATAWDRLLRSPVTASADPPGPPDMATGAPSSAVTGRAVAALTAGLTALAHVVVLVRVVPAALPGVLAVLAALAVVVGCAAPSRLRGERRARREARSAGHDVTGALRGAGTLRAAGAAHDIALRIGHRVRRSRAARERATRWSAPAAAVTAGLPWAAAALVVAAMAGGDGTGGPAVVVTAVLATVIGVGAAHRAATGAVSALAGLAAEAERIRPAAATQATAPPATEPGPPRGAVAVDGVTVRHPGGDRPALEDVTVDVAPGEFVAVTGTTGSGKSTLLRVMAGLETPTTGRVRVGGDDPAGVDGPGVRRRVAPVLEDSRLVPADLLTNILGHHPGSRDDAWAAARTAGIAQDVAALPMGLDTVVGDDGSGLSGSRRRRVLLARAVAARPAVVVVDDPTGLLDEPTRRALRAGPHGAGPVTLVAVTQCAPVLASADRVVVLDRGRVAAVGPYEALVDGPDGLIDHVDHG